jgi:hypothetical protein
MANTITIDLDDSGAIGALDDMISDLRNAQTETEALAERGQEVVESQTKQIVNIQKQATELKTFASEANAQTSKSAEHFAVASENAAKAGSKVNDFVNSAHEASASLNSLSLGIDDSSGKIGRFKGALAGTAAGLLAPLSGLWDLKKELLALPIIAGITVGSLVKVKDKSVDVAETSRDAAEKVDSWSLAFSRLSLKTATVAGGVTAFIAVGAKLATQAKEIRDENEKASGGFDQLKGAAAGASYALLRPFQEAGPAARDFAGYLKGEAIGAMDRFRIAALEKLGITETVLKNSAKGLKDWGAFLESWIDEARGNFVRFENSAVKALGFKGDDNADRYVEEAKALRDLAAWHEKMNKQREKERAGFAALGEANRANDQAMANSARAKEIAELKTIGQIEREIYKVRELAGVRAQSGKISPEEDDAHKKRLRMIEDQQSTDLKSAKTKQQRAKIESEAAKEIAKEESDYISKIGELRNRDLAALEQRRTQITEEESNKRLAKEKETAESLKRVFQSLNDERNAQGHATAIDEARDSGASERRLHEMRLQWIDEEAEARSETAKSADELVIIEAEAEKKRISETEQFRRDEIKRTAEAKIRFQQTIKAFEDASNEVQQARIEFADQMELQSLQLKLDSQRNFAAKTKEEIEGERQLRLEAQRAIHDKRIELIDREEERAIKSAKTQEETLKAAAEAEKRRLRENADFDKAMAQEAHDHKIKLAEDEQRKKDELQRAKVDALKPVAEQIIGTQTGQQRVQELQRLRGQQARDKAVADAGFQKFEDVPSEVKRAAVKAEQEARRQAFRDAMQGNVGSDEQAQVAQNLAGKTIGQMAKQGKVSAELLGTQQQAVQVMAQQQANTDALSNQVKQVSNALEALKNASDPGRWRAGFGGQKG